MKNVFFRKELKGSIQYTVVVCDLKNVRNESEWWVSVEASVAYAALNPFEKKKKN